MFKDALLQKYGICKVYWDDSERVERETYENLSDDEFNMLIEEDGVEVLEHTEYISETFVKQKEKAQKIQNLTIRTTCERYNYKFLLSSTEYIFDNSFKMLENLINNYISNIDGIAFYSIFQLPLEKKLRDKYVIKILNKNK